MLKDDATRRDAVVDAVHRRIALGSVPVRSRRQDTCNNFGGFTPLGHNMIMKDTIVEAFLNFDPLVFFNMHTARASAFRLQRTQLPRPEFDPAISGCGNLLSFYCEHEGCT